MSQLNYLDVAIKASYYTLNELTEKTKRVWLLFHGYGQLSEYFLKKFQGLDSEENFLIAPQGLSKFYLEGFTGRVGASWMTKEDRLTEIENQHRYLDAILREFDLDWNKLRLCYFGFSQGVATMCRYSAHAKLSFDQMILWAGTFPPDLTKDDFEFTSGKESVKYFTGQNDPFFKPGMKEEQLERVYQALNIEAEVTEFEGKHEILTELVNTL